MSASHDPGDVASTFRLIAVVAVLTLVGGATAAWLLVEGRRREALTVAGGVVLVVVGYLASLADSLDYLPDLLTPAVDDEGAVATLLGVVAMLTGVALVLAPSTALFAPRPHWAFALFALLGLVLVTLYALTTLAASD
jgi:hypothetical protein